MTEHPELLLSAYLDDALSQGDHQLVRAHLDGCERCRTQLAELQATSRLIGALPQLLPRRSLVPRLERAPVWLRPVRLLGAMGSGLFVFLFIASAIVNSGSGLGGGASTAEQLAEKGQFGAAVNALASDAVKGRTDSATAAPANAPVPAPASAAASQADGVARSTAGSPTPATAFAPPTDTGAVATGTVTYRFGPPPQLFLLIAVLLAIAAFVAHRRLHRA